MVSPAERRDQRIQVLLSESQLERLSAAAKREGLSRSAFVREAVKTALEDAQEELLAEAAEALAPLYDSDPELVAFTALDGEGWHE